MKVLFSREFGIDKKLLERAGVFDALIDGDRGTDKTVVEIKLTSNNQCVHGLEVQIEEYAKSEGTKNKIFVLVDTGDGSFRIKDVLKKHKEMLERGENPADVIVIDAKPKASASMY